MLLRFIIGVPKDDVVASNVDYIAIFTGVDTVVHGAIDSKDETRLHLHPLQAHLHHSLLRNNLILILEFKVQI